MSARGPVSLPEDNAAFEDWLAAQCDVVQGDLKFKHERMRESAFMFFRATFFRWARTIAINCPEAAKTQPVLAVGDIHVENYGVWRDREGRLIWGVNDFDEAAVMPYAFDLVRLAVSGFLFPELGLERDHVVSAILEGYEEGLAKRAPVVLDRDYAWLRPLVTCSDEARSKFWTELDNGKSIKPDAAAKRALLQDLPRRAVAKRFIRRPRRGGGSLGKPRFAIVAEWRGGAIAREAKAATPSAWDWAQGKNRPQSRALELARSSGRAPDPFFDEIQGFFVRRIAPDSRKIDFDGEVKPMVRADIITLMGQELGALHAETGQPALGADKKRRRPEWLRRQAEAALTGVKEDYEAWKGSEARSVGSGKSRRSRKSP